jgi:hypothetical protein
VRQEVDVEVVIPGYVSAEVVKPESLVRHYRERLSVSFPVLTDAPYAPVSIQQSGGDGGQMVSTPVDDYVKLLDQQKDPGGNGSGTDAGRDRDDPYREAFEHIGTSLADRAGVGRIDTAIDFNDHVQTPIGDVLL